MQLRDHHQAFGRRGAEIVAISSEDRAQAAQIKREEALPFPILSDPEHRVIDAYGVFHDDEPKGRPIARPATFVLDAVGAIRYRYVGENPSDRPSPDEILAAVPATGGAEVGQG